MNYDEALGIVMLPTRWLVENDLVAVRPDNLRKLGLPLATCYGLERMLLASVAAVQTEFLTYIPHWLHILNNGELYSERYTGARAPAGLKPRLALAVTQLDDGALDVHWRPHEEDFEGISPMLREDSGDVNRIIHLPAELFELPEGGSLEAQVIYLGELHAAIVQGLRSLVLCTTALAEVDLEDWIEFDPITGAQSISTPDMRAEALGHMGRDLCAGELEDQAARLQAMLQEAGFSDLDAYRAAQRASAGNAPAAAVGVVRSLVSVKPHAALEQQIQEVLRLEREMAGFSRVIFAAEEASAKADE
jgi:hypothetical protein